MNDEYNNKTIIAALVVAIVVSLGGTVVVLTKLSGVDQTQVLTGFATTQDGYVNIDIASMLAIEIESGRGNIDFGTCEPNPNWASNISSELTQSQNNASMNCTGGSMISAPDYISVMNTGNVDGIVNVTSNTLAASLLGGTSPSFRYRSVTGAPSGCPNIADTQQTYLEFDGNSQKFCNNLSYHAGGNPRAYLYVNLTVPKDASTGSTTATLTFSAETI